MLRRVVIIDGYTDEPAGLGVPPYMGVYPRLIAGSFWVADKAVDVKYFTVDSLRAQASKIVDIAKEADLVVFIAGAEVPGHYLGGRPITFKELEYYTLLLKDSRKVLAGPAARFGFGLGGGSQAVSRKHLKAFFDEIVYGDPELYFYELAVNGWERADPRSLRESYDLANKAFIRGSRIIVQHPNYGWNLIVEIETYRGCPRWIVGGCSFCIEPRYGKPLMRKPEDVVREVEALYKLGARHFRIGKQPDILAYMSSGVGSVEFPKPNPVELEKLFYGIRSVAPGLRVLHIDNVNPGTIAHNPEESIRALKIIVKYHTPGDVAAMGVETFDERVVKANNLKVYPDEALKAVEIVNRIGSVRGWNGLPHLLPGINLLHGLPGESRETFRVNLEYLEKIAKAGFLIRRVNVRKVAVLENTPLWLRKSEVLNNLKKYEKLYSWYRVKVMKYFDRRMLAKITPPGTMLRYLYTEKHVGAFTIARMPGSYPIAVKIPGRLELRKVVDARVKSIAAKSVTAEQVKY